MSKKKKNDIDSDKKTTHDVINADLATSSLHADNIGTFVVNLDDDFEVAQPSFRWLSAEYEQKGSKIAEIWGPSSTFINRSFKGPLYKIENYASRAIRTVDVQHDEHEETRNLISDRFDELPKKDDLLKAKEEIIKNLEFDKEKLEKIITNQKKIIQKIENESKVIQESLKEQIRGFQENLSRFLPYKRALKTSFYFLALFLGCIWSEILLDIRIMEPFWAWLGLIIFAGFLVMSYFMLMEWKRKLKSERSFN